MQLPAFLQPYSHFLFANRIFVILALCVLLFVTGCYALIANWQVDRLERDLAEARRAARSVAPRRMAEETAPEPAGGNLPPVRGGRTYARNLGNALQKAGGPPPNPGIYSPPVPTGWTPNVSGPGAPPQQQSPFPAPWAPPGGAPQPNAAPWGFNQPGRPGIPGPPPLPQFPGPLPMPAAQQGGLASPGFPPFLTGAPFAPASPAGSPSPAGPFAAPPMPNQPGAPLGAGQPPVAQQPPAAPEPPEAARSKAKRRRFNFSVLENLEKMVQQRPAEPGAAILQPPIAVPAPQPPLVQPPAATTPVYSPPTAPSFENKVQTPPAEKAAGVPAEPVQASLDLPAAPTSDSPTSSEVIANPPAEAAPAVPPVQEEKKDFRKSMRSMLFGEEASRASGGTASTSQEEKAASEPAEEKPAVSDNWPWSQIGKSSAEETVQPTGTEEPAQSPEEQPAGEPAGSGYSSEYTFDTSSTEQQQELPGSGYSFKAESEASPEPTTSDAGVERSTEEPGPETTREEATDFSFDAGAAPEQYTLKEPPADPADGQAESADDQSRETAGAEEAGADKQSTSPEASSDGSAAGTAEPASEEGDGRGTVVIIEDDQSVADYYSTLFKGNGYRVEVANDGVSGVDLCARVQPSVILLDVMMPRQNGILVLQTLRASDETRNTPVVVLSNFSEPTLIKRAIQLGALEYVIKTQVEGSALLDAMTRWINREKAFAA